MYVRRKWAKSNSLGLAKKQWMECINHLWNGFQGEALFQVHKAVTTLYHYHPCKLHTSYLVKASLMLVLMILIFPQLSSWMISDQWCVTCLYDSWWLGDWVWQPKLMWNKVMSKFNLCSYMGHIKHLIDQKLKVHAMCQLKTFFVRYLLLTQQLDELIK